MSSKLEKNAFPICAQLENAFFQSLTHWGSCQALNLPYKCSTLCSTGWCIFPVFVTLEIISGSCAWQERQFSSLSFTGKLSFPVCQILESCLSQSLIYGTVFFPVCHIPEVGFSPTNTTWNATSSSVMCTLWAHISPEIRICPQNETPFWRLGIKVNVSQ